METTAEGAAGRTQLSRATVIERALDLADTEGVGAVTVRRLTQELGVTPMALYWHFRNKRELLCGLADRALSEIDLTVDESAAWSDQLATLLRAMAATLRAHPWIPTLLGAAEFESESYLRALERLLGILRQAGFSPDQATDVAWHTLRTLVSTASEPGGMRGHAHPGGHDQARRETCAHLQGLPPDRFPRIVEAAVPLSRCDEPNPSLTIGLLLAGIRALAPERGSS